MEEHVHESCRVVYFCSSAQDDLHALYHHSSPPDYSSGSEPHTSIYRNVSALLDEHQGGFNEVFLTSSSDKCLDRLEIDANKLPTILLIELRNATSEVQDKNKGPFSFLRTLSTDIRGARYQKDVMPFVLLTSDSTNTSKNPEAEVTTSCFQAGAVDLLQSPLRHEDINRMIGHFKEQNRPPARLIGAPMAQNLVDSIHNVSKTPQHASYRPDELLSPERKQLVESTVREWHFPAQDFNMDELTYAAVFMLEHVLTSPALESYTLPRPQLVAFLLATRRQYKHEREVHYHNWRHAVDVSQCIFCFLLDLQICPPFEGDGRSRNKPTATESILTPLDGLILLISAIGHDVGHPGVNNAFLVACNHPLAQTYNDKSVLENYHCAAYQQLLRRHWPALNQIAAFRSTMISTILATDMQRHFEYMSSLADLKAKVNSSQSRIEWEGKERDTTRELLMALLIKAADISNIARPFDIAAKWARILMYEFARQGELESELQIPTCLFGGPPNTEDFLAAAQSQLGFMSLFGLPLFQGIVEILPSLREMVTELERNQGLWDEKINFEKRRHDTEAERPHFSGVTQEDIDEATEHRNSEPNAVPIEAIQTLGSTTKRVRVESPEMSPTRHGAHELRQQYVTGAGRHDEVRSSAPNLASPFLLSPAPTSPSRRSSKDLALDSVKTSPPRQPSPNPATVNESAEHESWQVRSSYPNSRRGSKDESLTTILVTRSSSPRSGRKTTKSPGWSSRETGAEPVTPPAALNSIPSTEDPFSSPSAWPDGEDQELMPERAAEIVPATPEPPPKLDGMEVTHSESQVSSSTDAETTGGVILPGLSGDLGQGIKKSKSRTRLRSLKFWRRRERDRDMTGVPAGFDGGSASPGGASSPS